MAVYACSKCSRAISVSILPGGNPIAKADPENWAQSWLHCPDCPALICERCAPPGTEYCPLCYHALQEPSRDLLFELYFGFKPPPPGEEPPTEGPPGA
jgi:hypothetical protein